MKKSFSILLPMLALLFTSCPAGGHSCRKFMGMKGRVATMMEIVRAAEVDGVPGEVRGQIRYTFDGDGHLLLQIRSSAQGEESSRNTYQYKNGVCVSTSMMSPRADVIHTDRLIERKCNRELWEEQNYGNSYTTEFVREGDDVTITKRNNGNVTSVEYRKMDKLGNVLSSHIESIEEPTEQTDMQYDTQGRLIRSDRTRDGVTTVTTYSYSDLDAQGNWTTCAIAVNGVASTVTTRNIEYVK